MSQIGSGERAEIWSFQLNKCKQRLGSWTYETDTWIQHG